MNNVTLTGRLTRDPELKQLAGQTVCRMRLAIDNGQYDADYVDVATFGKGGAAAAKHLSKGDLIAVSGRLAYSEWKAEDGSSRSKHEVIGRVEFLSTKGSKTEAPATEAQEAPEARGEEVPF